jgi:hypothetical protein
MKMIIEVSGGLVQNIIATEECSIYLIDHDNLKDRGGDLEEVQQAQQPDCIYWDEVDFDEALQQIFAEYSQDEPKREMEVLLGID